MTRAAEGDLAGLRVLVVEDTLMVAEEISEELRDHGCVVLGPAPSVAAALKVVAEERLDRALLDVNLSGEECYPVAVELLARHVPFAFITGYSQKGVMPERFRHVSRLVKSFSEHSLIEFVQRNFGSS